MHDLLDDMSAGVPQTALKATAMRALPIPTVAAASTRVRASIARTIPYRRRLPQAKRLASAKSSSTTPTRTPTRLSACPAQLVRIAKRWAPHSPHCLCCRATIASPTRASTCGGAPTSLATLCRPRQPAVVASAQSRTAPTPAANGPQDRASAGQHACCCLARRVAVSAR